MYEEKTGKKIAADDDEEDHYDGKKVNVTVNKNSYEAKLMQKRVRSMTTSDGVYNFNESNKKQKVEDTRVAETRPSGSLYPEPQTPGGTFNPRIFK